MTGGSHIHRAACDLRTVNPRDRGEGLSALTADLDGVVVVRPYKKRTVGGHFPDGHPIADRRNQGVYERRKPPRWVSLAAEQDEAIAVASWKRDGCKHPLNSYRTIFNKVMDESLQSGIADLPTAEESESVRVCMTCDESKPSSAFWSSGSKKSGTPMYALHCKACHEAGLVMHGYGPNCEWSCPQELDEWLESLYARLIPRDLERGGSDSEAAQPPAALPPSLDT